MRTVAVVAALALASTAAAQQPAAPPAAAPAAPPAAAPAPPPQGRTGWPRAIEVAEGTVLVYQPQLEEFVGVSLSGRAAVSWQRKDAPAPVFGVFWFEALVLVDKDARTMHVESVTVTKVRFPNIKPEQEQAGARLLEAEIPKWDLSLDLDEVQAAIAVSEKEKRSEAAISTTPPAFVFSQEPAVLLLYDGAPALRPLEQTGLSRVVNTAFFVVKDPAAGKLYLAGGPWWYEATDPMGPWTPGAVPTAAVKAVYDQNPPRPLEPPPVPEAGDANAAKAAAAAAAPTSPPRIIVATEPTELLVFDGKPSWVPVGKDGKLLVADNCDGKVLVHVATSETFVLASGRWFKARSLQGPWAFVRPDQLPAPFKDIPPDSPAAEVRPFVTGTREAEDAVADAQIPQTTAVKRDQALQVTWDGEPQFKQIEGTPLAYGVNTPFSVVSDSGRYWCCHQAVWYVADSPKGPWTVSDKRPPSIDQVPPSAPVYNTKYVYVYQSTPTVVYVGYYPGYVGVYPYYGTVVYGTGFYYPPYVGPVYCYPRPATWGVHVGYNPWTGWNVGVSYGTPFFHVGIHFGGYGGYYGPHGYRPPPPPHYGYRPPPPGYRPPPPAYRPPASPPSGSRPPSSAGGRPPPAGAPATRPSATPQPAGGNLYNRPENTARNAPREAANRRAPSVAQQPNNVYGDRSGNVYRQNQGGGWDRNTGSGWQGAGTQPAQRPATQPSAGTRPSATPSSSGSRGASPAGLDRDAAARSRSSGGYGGARPSGGARSGGGMRGGGRR